MQCKNKNLFQREFMKSFEDVFQHGQLKAIFMMGKRLYYLSKIFIIKKKDLKIIFAVATLVKLFRTEVYCSHFTVRKCVLNAFCALREQM